MKKLLAIIMSAMVAASMLPMMVFASEGDTDGNSEKQVQTQNVSDEAQATSDDNDEECDIEDCQDGDWFFDYIDGKVIITGYDKYDQKTVAIPSKLYVDDFEHSAPVTGIAKNADIDLGSCTKLIIPASITSIGKDALSEYHDGDVNLVVDCQCGSAGEKWALNNRMMTTNGVTKNVTSAAGINKKGTVITTCKKCGASGTFTVKAIGLLMAHANLGKLYAHAQYVGKNIYVETEFFSPAGYDGYCEGLTLTKGVDYTVSGPSTVKNVGTYTYTVNFKGFYSGKKSVPVKVVPKTTSIKKVSKGKKSFTVKWKKQTTQTSGYQIRYSTSKSMKKAKTVTVKGNKKTSKKIKKLKKKKTYYVQVRTYKTVKGKKYAMPWDSWASSKIKKVKTK